MIVQFATNSYTHDSLPLSAQRCVNGYAERQPPDAKTPIPVFGWPGLSLFSTAGNGPIRGGWLFNGIAYFVSGDEIYKVTSDGTATSVGTGIDGSDRVVIADNGTQMCIVTGSSGYIYTTAGGLEQIADADFEPAATVDYFDSYFVFDRVGTNQFAISGPLDGTAFDGADFASAEVSPDKVMAVVRHKDNLRILGQVTMETMYDDPSQNFPLQRIGGGLVERGVLASRAFVREDNAIFFVGNDRIMYRLDDITPKRISHHAIESAWRDYETVSDAFCDSISWSGHKFIVVQFPSEPATWVHDIATGLWFELDSWESTNIAIGRWRGNCVVHAYGKVLVGDYATGRIGELSSTTYDEFGNTLRMELTAPMVHQDRKRLFVSRFELDMETGVGLTSGQGSDPQVMLEMSDDGGRSWTSPEAWMSLGAIGAYTQRLRWLRQGNTFGRIYRMSITDPVKRTVLAAHADIKPGMA